MDRGWTLPAGIVLGLSLGLGGAQAGSPTYYKSGQADHCAMARDLNLKPDQSCASAIPVDVRGLSDPRAAIPHGTPGSGVAIQFAFASDKLTAQGRHDLDELAKTLSAASSSVAFNIDGHTDAVGTDAYNNELSMRRAETVVSYLRERGINATKLQAHGYGKTKPYDPSNPDNPINRRVEIHATQ